MKEETKKSVFETLYEVDVTEHIEKKGDLSYLSWAWAWSYVKTIYPKATYSVVKNPVTNLPFFLDEKLGMMCYTTVTIEDVTHEMWLPVMDGKHRAMTTETRTIKKWNKFQKKYEDEGIDAATMFEINTSVMRCLTKNLAMFGLGLKLYAGEDLVNIEDVKKSHEQPSASAPQTAQSAHTSAPAPKPSASAQPIAINPTMEEANKLSSLTSQLSMVNPQSLSSEQLNACYLAIRAKSVTELKAAKGCIDGSAWEAIKPLFTHLKQQFTPTK